MAAVLEKLIGHEKVMAPLKQAIDRRRLPSALLFVGPSGIGKRQVALGLSQLLVCDRPEEGHACGACGPCLRMEAGQSESLFVVKPDGQQIKMEQAQEVIRFLSLRSVGRAQIVLIDEAHTLNPQAANALLKLMEEPPEGSYFFLITPSDAGLLPTIRSRCQTVRFPALKASELKQLIQEAPEWVIESAQGRVDLASELMAEEFALIRNTAMEIWELLAQERSDECIERLQSVLRAKEDALSVARLWLQLLRDARVLRLGNVSLIHGDWRALIEKMAAQPLANLDEWAEDCINLERDILANVERSLCFENFLLKVKRMWMRSSDGMD